MKKKIIISWIFCILFGLIALGCAVIRAMQAIEDFEYYSNMWCVAEIVFSVLLAILAAAWLFIYTPREIENLRKSDKKLLVPKDDKYDIERIPMRFDCLDGQDCSFLSLSREEIRKETVKEILNKVKERSVWFIENPTQKDHFSEQMQELSKEYETGIKQ